MDLDPRLLRYFIAVAEERHFNRAAQRLHISQPPVSYAIQQLESTLGVKLLQRTSRSVTLTEAGRVFYREAQTLLRLADDVGTLVWRVDAGLTGRLKIGFVGSMLYRGLAQLLSRLRETLPDVEHVLLELNSNEQIEAVRRGELDLGFIHANPVPDDIEAIDLVSEPFRVCIPQSHPRARQASIRLKDLAAEEFVLFSRSASPIYFETVLSMCAAAGFTPRIHHEVRHWLTVASLVSQGLGVSIVPACLAHSGLQGAAFLDFRHRTRSVTQLIQSRDRAGALHRSTASVIRDHFGVAT